MNNKTLAQAYAPFWITLSIFVSFVGSVSWGLNLQNEIKWVSTNKAKVCQTLSGSYIDALLRSSAINASAYDDSKTKSAINQAFVGTLITAQTLERLQIRDELVHYGCPIVPPSSSVQF